jgi:hypothetical protein
MNPKHTLSILFATTLCMASSLRSFHAELILLDRVYSATNTPEFGGSALSLLECIAEGRADEMDPLAASKIGLGLSDIQNPYLKKPEVRAYAFYRIGETHLPEALDYLARLKRADFEPDDSGLLWTAVCIGLDTARLNSLPDPQAKIAFLENSLQPSGGILAWWAANELCDRGSQKSLPLIRDSIKRGSSGQRGEDEIRYCEARIQVFSRDPDKVKALVSVLRINEPLEDTNLQLWAIRQLVALHLPEADQALDRYRTMIGKLPQRSAERQRLYVAGETIRVLKEERSRRGQ